MEDKTINTPAGQTIDRELLVAYLNTGTSLSPTWSPFGQRVESSSMSYDMGKDTKTDILGNTYTTMKKPVITQSFDALPLTADDIAAKKIHELAVIKQDVQALSSMDVLVCHFYFGESSAYFAERYPKSAISISDFGGDGGGVLTLSSEVTYGGVREVGNASKQGDEVTFTKKAV